MVRFRPFLRVLDRVSNELINPISASTNEYAGRMPKEFSTACISWIYQRSCLLRAAATSRWTAAHKPGKRL